MTPSSDSVTTRRKYLPVVRLIQLILLATVCWFVAKAMYQGLSRIDWENTHFAWGYISAACACLVGHMIFVGSAFHSLLGRITILSPWHFSVAATWLSRAGKYIPGKVFSVMGLAYLLHKKGVSGYAAVTSALLNTILVVVVGLIVAAPLLALDPDVANVLPAPWLISAGIMLVGLMLLHPGMIRRLLSLARSSIADKTIVTPLRWSDYARPAVHVAGQWLTAGMALWCVCRSIDSSFDIAAIPQMVSLSALAIVGGFLALFAPAGIGVREAIYLAVLTRTMGLANASVAIIAMRLIYTVIDLLLAAVGLVVLKLTNSEQMTAEDPSALQSHTSQNEMSDEEVNPNEIC